jgi:hypothetical protein
MFFIGEPEIHFAEHALEELPVNCCHSLGEGRLP